MRKCQNCNKEILDDNTKICPICGSQLKRQNKNSTEINIILISVIIAIVAIPTILVLGMIASASINGLMHHNSSSKNILIFKKALSSLHQAQIQYINSSDEISNFSKYINTNSLWNGMKSYLQIDKDYGDSYILTDGSYLRLEKTKELCEFEDTNSPCGYITIDVNNTDEPNEYTTDSTVNDKFKVLLYANYIEPDNNSPEYNILHREIK